MWLDYIWNIPLFWWLLITAFVIFFIIVLFTSRKPKNGPLKKQLDYFCRCYARGEISRGDFEELKQDLQEFEKKNVPEKQETS